VGSAGGGVAARLEMLRREDSSGWIVRNALEAQRPQHGLTKRRRSYNLAFPSRPGARERQTPRAHPAAWGRAHRRGSWGKPRGRGEQPVWGCGAVGAGGPWYTAGCPQCGARGASAGGGRGAPRSCAGVQG